MKQKLLADIAHQTNSVEQGETQPLKKPKKTNRINQDTNDGVFPLILDLYAPINARIADITYGKGVFWKHIDTSKYEVFFTDLKRDGLPKQCVGGIDSQRLPYEDSYLDVVVFDLPYMHTPGGTAHNGHQNYEQYYKNNSEQDAEIVKKIWEETGGNPPKYHEAVLDLYFRTADEAWRVLAEDGVFIVKCQDEPDDDILKKIAHQAEA